MGGSEFHRQQLYATKKEQCTINRLTRTYIESFKMIIAAGIKDILNSSPASQHHSSTVRNGQT